jgi:hypothetical protein
VQGGGRVVTEEIERTGVAALSSEQMEQLMSIRGAVSESEIAHLFELATQVRVGCIVEVGAFRGRATAALAMGSLAGFKAPVFVIDPHEEFVGIYGGKFGPEDRGSFFETMLKLQLYPIIRLINLSSEWLSRTWPLPVSLLWIDGDHTFEGVKRDIDCWLPKLHDEASIVFDDALDPTVGPCRIIEQLTVDPSWTRSAAIGKTVTIVRRWNTITDVTARI